jgi:Na+/phosphate symporter
MRELTQEEKDLNNKSINRLTEEVNRMKFNLKRLDLELEGIDFRYSDYNRKLEINNIKEKIEHIVSQMNTSEKLIQELIKQNTEGVESNIVKEI